MKPGDLVRTKCPGFGTGPVARTGVIIDACTFGPLSSETGVIHVLDSAGRVLEWYSWQLENLTENPQ